MQNQLKDLLLKRFFLILLSLFTGKLLAQNECPTWKSGVNNAIGIVDTPVIKIIEYNEFDSSGNCYIVGRFLGKISFGNFQLSSSGGMDIFIAKLDKYGRWDWALRAGGPYNDFCNGLKVDKIGNIYLSGTFYDTASFGSNNLVLNGFQQDIFVAKINNKGSFQWAKRAGYGWNDKNSGIDLDSLGNSFIYGYFDGLIKFDSLYVYELKGGIYLAKIDSTGQWQSVKNIGLITTDQFIIDSTENSYFTGNFRDSIRFGNIKLNSSGKYDYEIFIAKINKNNQWEWALQLKGISLVNTVKDVKLDFQGNIIVTGYFVDTLTFGSTKLISTTGSSFFAKLSSSGQWLWATKVDKVNTKSITTDLSGNSYITGDFTNAVNFGKITLNSLRAGFVAKLDSSGQWQWAIKTDDALFQKIDLFSKNKIYLTGSFVGSIQFAENILTTKTKYAEIFVAKLSEEQLSINAGSNQNIACKGSIKLNVSGTGIDYVKWYPGTGLSDPNILTPIASPEKPTTYTVTAKNNCGDSAISQVTVNVNPGVKAGFFAKDACIGDAVIINDSATTASSYIWYFGDGNASVAKNPKHLYKNIGTYTISQVVYSVNGCSDSISKQVTIHPRQNVKISGNSFVCPTSIINYNTSSDTSVNNIWSITGGTIQSGQGKDSISVLWNTVGNGSVKLVKINSTTGCQDSTILSVKIDSSACDWVWPGDANHDKITNSTDVLNIGLAYNETGAARNNASSSWKAQYADNWSKSFKNGINFKHADCNGDGSVDSTDIKVINNNYGQTWKKQSEIQAPAGPGDAALILEITKDSILAGDTVIMNINLGTTDIPAKDVYGLAFYITFDNQLVESNSIKLDLSNSLLDATGKELISLVKDFNANGTADIAISKTDKINSSGEGTIGTLSFVIKKDLGGQGNVSKVLNIEIQDIIAISASADTIRLNKFGDSVITYQKTSGILKPDNQRNINIYPNPSTGNFIIDLQQITTQKIQVINVLGQEIWRTNNVQGKTEIQLGNVNAGLYFINIQTLNGVITKPLIINK